VTTKHDDESANNIAAYVMSLEEELIDRGLLDVSQFEGLMETYFAERGYLHGARAVARAWVDANFKALLLSDAPAAFEQLGVANHDPVTVVENTDEVHNVVVCTLCSCYPFWVLGLSPGWYRSLEYRARVVREPREVLAEFGVQVPDNRAVRVWDSSSDIRYIVMPRRPPGTESATEEDLVRIITRDSLIGTEELV
jgi:nitrile hydratase subunit alpha